MLDDCQPSCIVASSAMAGRTQSQVESVRNGSRSKFWQRRIFRRMSRSTSINDQSVEQSIALLQYTSGSTSMPKGVIVRHGNMMANQQNAEGCLRTATKRHGGGMDAAASRPGADR